MFGSDYVVAALAMFQHTLLGFQDKSSRCIHNRWCLAADEVVPNACDYVDVVKAMREPRNDPWHGKTQPLLLEFFEELLELWVTLDSDEVDELIEYAHSLLEGVEEGVT